jgi:hypothetical protein
MIVNVHGDGTVALLEAEDTRAFKLVAPREMGMADLARALAGAADVEAGHAWVSRSWVLDTSPLASSESWRRSFAEMLDYARSKGWLRASDEAIRAHIERR